MKTKFHRWLMAPALRALLSTIRAFTLFAVFAAARLASAVQDTWIGAGSDNNWTTPANWAAGTVPMAGDTLNFTGITRPLPVNNFLPGTAFDGIIFDTYSTSFTLSGSDIVLSGAAVGNTFGVFNNYGISPNVDLNLTLDWGYYVFGGGGGVALNGTLSPGRIYQNNGSYLPLGGVAYFDGSGNITSSSPLDLGGAGLIVAGDSPYTLALLPLATVIGGFVGPLSPSSYTSYPSSYPAAVDISASPPNANVELSAAPVANMIIPYIDNNGSVNTITIDQNPGDSAGNEVVQLTTTGTLTLGGQGGIYVTGSGAGAKQIFKLTGGSLTAAPNNITGGMIVLGINGDNLGNQMQLNSTVEDNSTAFPSQVTLVKVGPGSLVLTTTNTYSGGTYVDQGYLEDFQGTGFGTGPVYVASGATVYLQHASGTWANNFYISPGTGPSYSTDGAIRIGNGNRQMTLSGKLNLLGSPVSSAPGDRIDMTGNNGIAFLGGQITGTGTLELTANAANANFGIENTNFNNNWTGGLLIDNAGNDVSWVRTYADDQLASNNVTLSASGTGVARLDLSGFNQTIGGLFAPSNPSNQVANNVFLTGSTTLTLGAGDASATFGGVISDGGPNYSLSIVKIGAGIQTLTGVNTYFGATTISAGTLALTGAGSIAGLHITVASGAIFDVSGLSSPFGLDGPNLSGGGTVNGDVTVAESLGAAIYPGGGGAMLTHLTFSNNVVFGPPCYPYPDAIFDLSSTYNGPNDQIVLAGNSSTLTANNTYIAINSAGILDTTHDYVLFNLTGFSPSIIGSFNPTPSWLGTTPANASEFSIVTTATQVLLHYGSPTIRTQPTDQTACANSPASFTVTASGAAPLSFQWYASPDGQTGWSSDTTSTVVSDANSSTLTATAIPALDGYYWEVVVTDGNGSSTTSSAATLTVNPLPGAPTITTQNPPAAGVCANSTMNSADGSNNGGTSSTLWTIIGGTITSDPFGGPGVSYTAGASGNVVLTLTAYNADGCSSSTSVTIPINPAPVAVADTLATALNTPLTVPATCLLANDRSLNNGALSVIPFATSPTTLPGGTASSDGSTVTYTPPPTAIGGDVDTFTYTLSDTFCTAQGTVSVKLISPAIPPLNKGNITVSGNCQIFVFNSGAAGSTWVIQSNPHMSNGWVTLQTVPTVLTADSNGLVIYVDGNCSDAQQSDQFYRFMSSP